MQRGPKIQLIQRFLPPYPLRGIFRFVTINFTLQRITLFVHCSLVADNEDYIRYLIWRHTNAQLDTPFDIQIDRIRFPPTHPQLVCTRHRFVNIGNPHAPHASARRHKRLASWEGKEFSALIHDLVSFAFLIARVIKAGPPRLRL